MDLLKRFTIKNLKLNKKRTIVTIIGIILSVALITAVGTMFMSARASLIEYEVQTKGNFHAVFRDVDAKEINDFTLNRKVSEVFLSQNLGYSKLDGIKNEYKPYIYVRAYSKASQENLGVNITQGRLPENENEIVIPNHLDTNGGLELELGDKIYLEVGQRQSGEDILNQNYEYIDDETLVYTVPKEYTIVGFMERPGSNIEPYSAPGYTAITYLNTDKITSGTFDVYVRYTSDGLRDYINTTANLLGVDDGLFSSVYDPEDVGSEEFMNNMEEVENTAKYDFGINSYLITLETGMTQNSTLSALMSAALVVIVVIIFTSIFCIKNSFDISITEKIKQYGMLASIGATKKQIKKNVYYEAFVLGLIGIPLGIIFGVLAAYILVKISNIMMTDFMAFDLVFSFSYLIILFSVLLGLITIFLSARSSSRKASKVSPIQAITNGENIKLKARKLKVPKIISKVFGVGGEISYKNLKRSRKKYRTTVISIVVSVTIFISLTAFMSLAFDSIDSELNLYNYNLSFSYNTNENDSSINEKVEEIAALDDIKEISTVNNTVLNVQNPKFSENYSNFYPEEVEQNQYGLVTLILDQNSFKEYAEKLNLNYEEARDKAILLNKAYVDYYDEEKEQNMTTRIDWFTFEVGDDIIGYVTKEDETVSNFEVEICEITEESPLGIDSISYMPYLIVSDDYLDELQNQNYFRVYINTDNAEETQDEIYNILTDYEIGEVNNISSNAQSVKSLYTLLAIFLYGFIIVISLIGITSIFNTLTTNMNLRSREFASLKSIGMTKKEFNRMVRLESFFYGTKALIISIPLGTLLAYFMYKQISQGTIYMHFEIPIIPIIISIVAVYILVLSIMRYSIKKINKQNIIDTIRNENI